MGISVFSLFGPKKSCIRLVHFCCIHTNCTPIVAAEVRRGAVCNDADAILV
jgi:hypothetical protein